MRKTKTERRVDAAMEKACYGLQVPLSKLVDMRKLCVQAADAEPGLEGDGLVAKCRAIMVQQGSTETGA